MDVLQNVDAGSALLLAVGCVLLCVVLFVILSVLQFVGGLLEIFGSILGGLFDVISGGPASWCGCLVLIAAIVVCGGLILLLAQAFTTCGTPQAVNFCQVFGR